MQDIIDDIQLPKELLEKRTIDLTGEDFYQIVTAAIKSLTLLILHRRKQQTCFVVIKH